jgi:NADPH:quinone reductase-like Zn-dependent oxidoreductase
MKAAQIDRYGTPDVLRINEVGRPAPGEGEVLVRVEASSVNGHDVIVRSGGLKMVSGRKFPLGTGLDFAGVVAEADPGADGDRAGDRVWGTVHPRQRHVTGAAAEYVTVPADRIAPAPAALSPADAASLVVAGTTALIALRDSTHLARGERVLVRGAAGGVGTAAVQLAHAMGGHVTALARDHHARALAGLGADRVLGYDATPEQTGTFDVIIDTAGSDLECWRRRLTRNGRMVTVGLSASALAAIGLSAIHGSRRIRTFSANPDTAILVDLAGYIAAGALRPVVSSVFPLADIAAAHQAFSQGGTLGKLVVAMTA